MKTNHTLLLLSALGLCFPGMSQGQTTLTWADSAKEASQRNPELLSARESLRSAENRHLASLGQFLPQVSLGASLNRSGDEGDLDAILSEPNSSHRVGLSLSARQQIFSGFADIAKVDSANAQVRQAQAQLMESKAQLSRDLTASFYGLLFSQRQLKLLETIAERRRSNARLVELTYQGGKDNKGSFLQAEAASVQASYEVAQARRSLKVAQRELARLLDRDPLAELQAQGEFEVPEMPSGDPDLKELALGTPAYLQALSRLHSAESGWVSARAAFLPDLSANASLSRGGENFSSLSPSWSAGLSLSYPLFTGGQDLFNYRSAEDSKRGAGHDLRNAYLSAIGRLETAHTGFQNAVERVAVQRAFLKAAQVRGQIAKAEYMNGLLNFQNWDQIETELTNQEKSELSSLLTAKTAEADWQLTQGKGEIP